MIKLVVYNQLNNFGNYKRIQVDAASKFLSVWPFLWKEFGNKQRFLITSEGGTKIYNKSERSTQPEVLGPEVKEDVDSEW